MLVWGLWALGRRSGRLRRRSRRRGRGFGGHSTAYSGTGASTLVGPHYTKWMNFLGNLATQVPQPLHLA